MQRRRVALVQHSHAHAQLALTPRTSTREIREREPLVPVLVPLRQIHRREIDVDAPDDHVLADSRLVAHSHHDVTRLEFIRRHLHGVKVKQLIPQRRRRLFLHHRFPLLRVEARALQVHLAHHVGQTIRVHRLRLQLKTHQRLKEIKRLNRLQVFRLHQSHRDRVPTRGRGVSRGLGQFLRIHAALGIAPKPPHDASARPSRVRPSRGRPRALDLRALARACDASSPTRDAKDATRPEGCSRRRLAIWMACRSTDGVYTSFTMDSIETMGHDSSCVPQTASPRVAPARARAHVDATSGRRYLRRRRGRRRWKPDA